MLYNAAAGSLRSARAPAPGAAGHPIIITVTILIII